MTQPEVVGEIASDHAFHFARDLGRRVRLYAMSDGTVRWQLPGVCTHPPSSQWKTGDDEGCRDCLAERLAVTEGDDPQGDPWASPSASAGSQP